MVAALGLLFASLSIERLCFLYFFLVPVFLPREDVLSQVVVFGFGYLLSIPIVILAMTERMLAFAHFIRPRKISLVMIALIAMCFITVAINTPRNLFFSTYGYYFKYLKLIFPVICSFVMANIWSERDLPKLYLLLAIMVGLSVAGLIPEAVNFLMDPVSFPRFGSYFLEPNKYALFLNIFYGMTLADFIGARLRGERKIPLLLINLGIVVVLFMTQSRSGILTWAVLTVVAFWPKSARGIFRQALPILIPIGAVLSISIAIRYTISASDASGSDLGRVWTYLVALNIIAHRPFAGVGFANILESYAQYGGVYTFLLRRPMAVHNTFLEIFAEEGVFGAVLYLILIFTPMVVLGKRITRSPASGAYPAAEIAALAIPVAFFCFGMFYPNYLSDDYFWIYMAFTLVVMRTRIPEGFRFEMAKPKWL